MMDVALQQAIVDDAYEDLLSAFLAWAQEQQSVRAVVQVGSRARSTVPADQWSDLDLILFVDEPARYLDDTGWIEEIAPVWIVLPSRTASNDPELLVMFEGGYNVDFVICPTEGLRRAPRKADPGSAFVRGARILIDRDGRAAKHVPEAFGSPVRKPPTKDEFISVCDAFWYAAVYVARQIARGELWLAKVRDGDVKQLLLAMLEWHAGTHGSWQTDTWHMGRHIEEWADPHVLGQVRLTFGGYDAEPAAEALVATIRLFQWTAQDTSDRLGYHYPRATEARCMRLILEALP